MIQRLLLILLFVFSFHSGWNQIKLPTKATKSQSIDASIKNELETALEKYRNEKSTETVWRQMRKEADDILFTYFHKGKLLGVTKNQAYFIKIGPDTMTATDIKNNKKILMAGIAIQKPAEFVIINIEK